LIRRLLDDPFDFYKIILLTTMFNYNLIVMNYTTVILQYVTAACKISMFKGLFIQNANAVWRRWSK